MKHSVHENEVNNLMSEGLQDLQENHDPHLSRFNAVKSLKMAVNLGSSQDTSFFYTLVEYTPLHLRKPLLHCLFHLVMIGKTFPTQEFLQFGDKCTPGEEWQDNCRWCMCEDDGTPSCGKISCNFGSVPGMARRKRRSPYPIPTVSKPKRGCTPGSRWKDECDNNCFCNERGVAICTEKGCIRH
ncbi:hypothetical protein AAG570_011197 [Ranatra chinensis]|uniref:Pacifastin domain-containing protein n=1 Tax=Ranatra chinensis TaxID=642074 RepID=A0ABD0YJX7_9HEMI